MWPAITVRSVPKAGHALFQALTREQKSTVRSAGGYPARGRRAGPLPLPECAGYPYRGAQKRGRNPDSHPGRSGAGDLGGDAQTGALRETDASQAADCPHAGIACATAGAGRFFFTAGFHALTPRHRRQSTSVCTCLCRVASVAPQVGTLCQIMLPRSPAVVAHRIFQYFAFSSDTPVVPALAAVIHPVVFPLTIT